jgi:hypothetical protein
VPDEGFSESRPVRLFRQCTRHHVAGTPWWQALPPVQELLRVAVAAGTASYYPSRAFKEGKRLPRSPPVEFRTSGPRPSGSGTPPAHRNAPAPGASTRPPRPRERNAASTRARSDMGGPGVDLPCTVCAHPITSDQVEYEVQFARDGGHRGLDRFHLHLRCFPSGSWRGPRSRKDAAQLDDGPGDRRVRQLAGFFIANGLWGARLVRAGPGTGSRCASTANRATSDRWRWRAGALSAGCFDRRSSFP